MLRRPEWKKIWISLLCLLSGALLFIYIQRTDKNYSNAKTRLNHASHFGNSLNHAKDEKDGRNDAKRARKLRLAKVPADLCQVDVSSGAGEDRRPRKDELTIAEYNVEWLFLNGGKGALTCPGTQCPWPDKGAAQVHLERVIKKLDELDADILHLVEVESCQVLEKLRAGMKFGHLYRAYMIPSTDQATGQNCGLLTRLDPIDVLRRTEVRRRYAPNLKSKNQMQPSESQALENQALEDQTEQVEEDFAGLGGKLIKETTGVSKHYMAKFSVPVGDGENRRYFPLYLLGAHLLARPTDKVRVKMREAQAIILRTWLTSILKKEGASYTLERAENPIGVVLLGDLNDFDGDVLGADNELPKSKVLSILKGRLGLYNVVQTLPQSRRYTAWYDKNHDCQEEGNGKAGKGGAESNGTNLPFEESQRASLINKEHSLIDHILVNDYLRQRLSNVTILNDERVSCQSRTSDHWPTKATFSLK